MSKNKTLPAAKSAKNDEFYTQYSDIQKEINAYLDYDPDVFRGKTVLLPCDDPEWSNFTRFFAQNFETLGLKKLISTSYAPDAKKEKYGILFEYAAEQNGGRHKNERGRIFVLDHDTNKSGRIDLDDLEWEYLEGDGDFRSEEVCRLRDEADVIVTNPPFSLFREFLAWIIAGRNCHTDWFGPNGPHGENDSANAVRREPIRGANQARILAGGGLRKNPSDRSLTSDGGTGRGPSNPT